MWHVAVHVEDRAWGCRGEGEDEACVVGGVVGGEEGEREGILRINVKEQ